MGAIERQRPRWNQAVEMEVIAQRLVPGVKHTDETEQTAEVSTSKLEQGLRDRFEQDVADDFLVGEGERIQFVREGEDEMEVTDR